MHRSIAALPALICLQVLRLVVERAAAIGAARLIARTTSDNAPAIATLRRVGAVIRHGEDDSVYAEIPLDRRSP